MQAIKAFSENNDDNIQEQINSDIIFWKEFDQLVANSNDETLLIEDFPRAKFN